MTIKANSENIVDSAGFLIALALLSILSIYSCFSTKELVSTQENRTLAPFPHIHSLRKELSKFPAAFEQFFSDRVAFRLPLISAKNFITYELFNSSGNPLVGVGRHGWLFYNSYGVLPAQLNLRTFKDDDLQAWVKDLEARRAFLESHGIKFVVVFAPEKGTMYPELMPAGWHRRLGMTRLQQIQNYLKARTKIDFVDAESLLGYEKLQGQKIYHSNDTHWNQRSAFLVCQEILKHVHGYFPQVAPVPATDQLQGHDTFTGDLAKMLGLQKTLPDESPSIVVRTKPRAVQLPADYKLASMGSQEPAFATKLADSALPRALVMRDSFFTYLTAPLSEHFRFCEYQWTNSFNPQAILDEHPDIVINEIAERHLYEEFHEHVPSFVHTSEDTKPICTFGGKFELVGITVQKRCNRTTLKLLWHNRQPVKLDYVIGIHCIDSRQKLAGGADYSPDILQRTVPANSTWLDTIKIPDREIQNAENLGVLVYHPSKDTLTCDAVNADWNSRYVVSLNDLITKPSTVIEQIAANGTSPPL